MARPTPAGQPQGEQDEEHPEHQPELEVELEMVEVTWATAIAALQADKIDMMFLDATPKRAMVVDLTVDYQNKRSIFILRGLPPLLHIDNQKPMKKMRNLLTHRIARSLPSIT